MGRTHRKKKKGKGLVVLLIVLIIAVAALFGFIKFKSGLGDAYIPGSTDYVSVNIPSGSSSEAICNILEQNGIVGSATKFKLYLKFNGYDGRLQAGDYSFSPSMTGSELVNAMLNGRNETVRFTIPEGYHAAQTAEALASKGLGDYDKFIEEIQYGDFDFDFINKLGYDNQGYRLEGVLCPNTYDVYVNATEHDVINRMLTQFDSIFTDEYYQRCNDLGLTMRQVLTIASLIERETKVDSERELVSSVIHNRLAKGMMLQIDATIQYLLGDSKEHLTYKDLEIDSPYNTYKNIGLPPGPICSPGEASIKAALYPAMTDYYYYVLSEKLDGTHNFSNDYATFEKNKSAYKRAIKG